MSHYTEKTLKMLWGRAGGRCSFENCRINLFYGEDDAPTPTSIGEICHIVAENEGQRANLSLSIATKNSYPNLILLCRNHHKVIDDIENGEKEYPIVRLEKIKSNHEEWVGRQLGFDMARQRSEEQWAEIVDEWQSLCHLENWVGWSSYILSSDQPQMRKLVSNDLEKARGWLLSRVWPVHHPTLKEAFINFRRVLEDFQRLFLKHVKDSRSDILITEKFYKIDQWDVDLYHKLGRLYEWHVDLVSDLMLELTRAANQICDLVRETFDHGYRRSEGVLTVLRGPDSDLSFQEFSVSYNDAQKTLASPYEDLESFILARAERDVFIGIGSKPA